MTRGTYRNFGLKVGIAGTVKFEGRIREPLRDIGGTIAAGEQGVMADAMELVGIERHRFVAAGPFDPIILPLEHNGSSWRRPADDWRWQRDAYSVTSIATPARDL